MAGVDEHCTCLHADLASELHVRGVIEDCQAIKTQPSLSTCPAFCSSFVLISANPVSSDTASVLLGRVSTGRVRNYNVRACWVAAPNNCKTKQCASVNCSPVGPLTPGRRYVVSATANMTTGQQVKAAATLTLTMPVATAPVLLLAEPAGRRSGTATALPPAAGACPGYFWVFAPVGGGAGFNTTTTSLSITTAGTALVPGGVYDVRVACVRSGTAAVRSLLQELGPFSNALRLVMPAAGAPFLTISPTTPTTATAKIQPPAGTGKRSQAHPRPGLHCSPGQTATHATVEQPHASLCTYIHTGWTRFPLTICPLGAPAASCRNVPCDTPASGCAVTNLAGGTTYTATAVAIRSDGVTSPPSNTETFTTCPAGLPVLCGTTCIAANTCCKTNPSVGQSCTSPLVCSADGQPCGAWGVV